MRLIALVAAALVASLAPASAQTIYPINRAEILIGSLFDLKVEFAGLVDPAAVKITINGRDHSEIFGRTAELIEREEGKAQSALILRDALLREPGVYNVTVTDGVSTRQIAWSAYGTGPRKARNVILFVGDGMSLAHRVAARLLSKGIVEGKAGGKLVIDDMPAMALVSTAGLDSIITDSANSMSAYATGHKSSVNAMGVYPDRTANPFDDPKVETIFDLGKRRLGLSLGIVTNTEIEDATPAAMVAHTRRRSEYDYIVEAYFNAKPQVLMGGGKLNFLPKSAGGRRNDDIDYIAKFHESGYAFAATATELRQVAPGTGRLLGLFHDGNLDGVLDRRFLKGGTTAKFPDQPDLTEQVRVALDILSRGESGFLLLVESGLIDKYTHALDMERAVYDTIMLDNAVKVAKDFAASRNNDTLILVLADHSHPIGLIGTVGEETRSFPATVMRERVGVYERAGFPNYPAPDADGYPAQVDVSRRLAIFASAFPDYFETFRPKLDKPFAPTVGGKEAGTFEANESYRDQPGAILRQGNIPRGVSSGVHSGEDVVLTASGPGSERVRGQMDNTEIFRVMADALGLGRLD
jgi:alkaline phosphatase